jgi:guanine nucleotide-binding protein G(i) subunit alpha
MRLHHVGGYTDNERDGYREIVYANLVSPRLSLSPTFWIPSSPSHCAQIQSMQVVLEAMHDLSVPLPPHLTASAAYIMSIRVPAHEMNPPMLSRQVTGALMALWADEGTKRCVGMSREFQLNDSAG